MENNIDNLVNNKNDSKKIAEYNKSLEDLRKYEKKEIENNNIYLEKLINTAKKAENIHKFDIALELYNKALSISQKIGNANEIANNYGNIGIIYQKKGDLDSSLFYYQQALEIAKKIGDDKIIVSAITNIGLVYQYKKEPDKSLEYFNEALEISKKINDNELIVTNLTNIGTIYLNKDKLDKSLEYHNKALEIAIKINNNDLIAHNLNFIGIIYQKKKEFDKSLQYYQNSLEFGKNNKEIVINNFLHIGNIYIEKNQREEALNYFYQAFDLSKTLDFKYLTEKSQKSILEIESSYIKSIEIKNYFFIKDLQIDNLSDKKEIYFVGENGDGKTILLQSIALGLAGSKKNPDIAYFIEKNQLNNFYIDIIDKNDLKYTFIYNYENKNIANNVFGYGVYRGRNDSDKKDKYGFLSLFRDDIYLNSPEKWLLKLDYSQSKGIANQITIDTAKNMINSILDKNVEIEIIAPETVNFIERGSKLNFSQLSDGYKSVIVWICDLLERLSTNQPWVETTKDFVGVVLIDEVELFLHPKWKYTIVRELRKWFPNIQFFITTHSSTVILGASKDAVFYRLYKDESGFTQVSKPISKISNLMLNEIITSPLFNLESAESAAFDEDIPKEISIEQFENNIMNSKEKKFINSIYNKKEDKYILKDNLTEEELQKLNSILIKIGYKEDLSISDDYLYSKIHREISKRVKEINNITDEDIIKMINEELDKEQRLINDKNK
ncbi:MAG: hypothetical protein A2086_01970 [Spirochaetes bacterium GWD1_27_9]|nr:MAG: hypothetical protein A2Z98_18370 [Spirochaetes bacterium GWB1_27_13]OHD41682.1 MAG: hypothetical protein A2086_01970 [Spirochaetes bacterium GWD1_27_9]